MLSQNNQRDVQKIAGPASLRTILQVFRVGQGKKRHYRVDDARGGQYTFEPWQFFVLDTLPDCKDFADLASAFEDRFGRPLAASEAGQLFAELEKHELLAMDHPIIAAFRKKQDGSVDGDAASVQPPAPTSDEKIVRALRAAAARETAPHPQANKAAVPPPVREAAPTPQANKAAVPPPARETAPHPQANKAAVPPPVREAAPPPQTSKAAVPPPAGNASPTPQASAVTLPPGVSEVVGMDDSRGRILWTLFDPSGLLRLLHPILLPFRYVTYMLPLILAVSFVGVSRHIGSVGEDMGRPLLGACLLISMVVVSLLVTGVKALVAYNLGAAVNGFCIHVGVLPSFAARIGEAGGLLRRQRVWLHAAPLLARMGLFGAGVLLWVGAGNVDGIWGTFGLALAATSAVSFLLAANPLIRDSAYHLISAYLEEPHIRQRSRQVTFGNLHGGEHAKVDTDVVAAYSLASATYTFVLIGIVLLLLHGVFHLHVSAYIFLSLVVIGVPVAWRMIGKFKELGRSHERKAQFQRWRKGGLPKGEVETEEKVRLSSLARYSLRASALLLVVVLFLPYRHDISGRIVVLPQEKQDVTSEVSGIIESINFDGGELLRKGTVIGRLSVTEYTGQVKILTAKIAEQEAVIAELRSRPRPEEVDVAQRNLQTEETRARFSKEELARMEKFYAEKTVSFEDLEDARREHELDLTRVKEKRASLDLIKAGAPPDEIAAAEAKLQSWEEERQLYLEKIEKSVFYAPIEGTLVATHLKQRVGSYFERGQPLAVVENTQQVFVQIDVAEEDIAYVEENAKVRVRFSTYAGQDIEGSVLLISPTVTEGRAGRVLEITALIDNQDGKLKSGMEGYAKISSESLPVWKVLSLGIIRFFNVEAWSWLP